MRPGDLVRTPWGDYGLVVARRWRRGDLDGFPFSMIVVGTEHGQRRYPSTQLTHVEDLTGHPVNLAPATVLKGARNAA